MARLYKTPPLSLPTGGSSLTIEGRREKTTAMQCAPEQSLSGQYGTIQGCTPARGCTLGQGVSGGTPRRSRSSHTEDDTTGFPLRSGSSHSRCRHTPPATTASAGRRDVVRISLEIRLFVDSKQALHITAFVRMGDCAESTTTDHVSVRSCYQTFINQPQKYPVHKRQEDGGRFCLHILFVHHISRNARILLRANAQETRRSRGGRTQRYGLRQEWGMSRHGVRCLSHAMTNLRRTCSYVIGKPRSNAFVFC